MARYVIDQEDLDEIRYVIDKLFEYRNQCDVNETDTAPVTRPMLEEMAKSLKAVGHSATHYKLPERENCPRHYMGDGVIECEPAMRSMVHGSLVPPFVAYWWGCAFKYLWRWKHKNGLEDLEKCIDCIERLKEDARGYASANR